MGSLPHLTCFVLPVPSPPNAHPRALARPAPRAPGGRKLLTSAAVTLAVLRRTLNCSLPVELVWHGKAEMDRATLKALDREFGPLRGYNIEEEPFPSHHRSK